MTFDPMPRIVADNDRDRAECRAWFLEATEADLIAVWDAIQKLGGDPVSEIVSRFAQLAFAEMLAELEARSKESTP